MRTRGRADQRFHALESIVASEPAHYRPYLLEDKLTSEGARERPCSLGDRRSFAGARRSLGEEKDRRSSGGAAYTQLFKGREIKGMVMGKNGIEIENLNLGKI